MCIIEAPIRWEELQRVIETPNNQKATSRLVSLSVYGSKHTYGNYLLFPNKYQERMPARECEMFSDENNVKWKFL